MKKGIEVGHIFKLGKKYSESLKLRVQGDDGDVYPEMGCYGIGTSRIIAASIEQNHDEKGIIWPKSLCPYEVVIVEANPKKKESIKKTCEEVYELLASNNIDVLWDDRDKRPGVKFKDMELIGIPIMIIIGDKSTEDNKVEIKVRLEEKTERISPQDILHKLSEIS